MKKTAVITGASKGIGAATAILFAQKGYNVVLNYNDSFESVNLLARSLSQNCMSVTAIKANVANRLEVELLMKETIYDFYKGTEAIISMYNFAIDYWHNTRPGVKYNGLYNFIVSL